MGETAVKKMISIWKEAYDYILYGKPLETLGPNDAAGIGIATWLASMILLGLTLFIITRLAG